MNSTSFDSHLYQIMESPWHLPEDAMDEILSRLPVKSILRFKSVCKNWYAFLSSPRFIAMHLNNNNNNSISWDDNYLDRLILFRQCFRFPHGIADFLPVNLKFDFGLPRLRHDPDFVLGPCEGLFCLSWNPNVRDPEFKSLGSDPYFIALCNPATREFSLLPHSNEYCYCDIGFGFDRKTNNCKVVKIISTEDFVTFAEVYTPSAGSWRRVLHNSAVLDALLVGEGFHGRGPYYKIMFNGVFYWYFRLYKQEHSPFTNTDGGGQGAILSFDMGDEVFQLTSIPKRDRLFDHITLGKRSDSGPLMVVLSFRDYFGRGTSSTKFEVWLMKNCDAEVSWFLESTLGPFPYFCSSLGLLKNNDLLMLRDTGMSSLYDSIPNGLPFLYNIVSKQARDFQLSGEVDFHYKETLVSIKGGC